MTDVTKDGGRKTSGWMMMADVTLDGEQATRLTLPASWVAEKWTLYVGGHAVGEVRATGCDCWEAVRFRGGEEEAVGEGDTIPEAQRVLERHLAAQ